MTAHRTIRGYELLEHIGAGGFGQVYRAHQPAVGRVVAIKVIQPQFASHPEFVRRFDAEAQLVARLEHPHIVPLYDYWREPDGAYLVMRWLRGGDLHQSLGGGPWSLEDATQLLDQISGALAVAHEQGVVHRDVKPENILLDEHGNAYLTDFGIAKDLVDATAATNPDAVPGSLWYISPEQAQSQPVNPQSDIYSLGVVMYEVLTGQHPFSHLTPGEQLVRRLTEPLPPLMEQRPGLPAGLDAVIQRATSQNPAERYPNAKAFATAFREALFGEPEAPPAAPRHNLPVEPTPFVGRQPELAALDRLLADRDARLVTVLGAGGMGKTRLALQAAAAQLDRCPHGVFFVSLAALDAVEGIVPTVADALGFGFYAEEQRPDQETRTPKQQLLDYLRHKRLLLVMDNYEHLLPPSIEGGTELVTAILHTAPQVGILATSRARLNLQGEQLFPVFGMRVPEWESDRVTASELEQATRYSAVQLFLIAARRAQPGFELNAHNVAGVVEVCRLVGGMPLGIVLAAAWVEMLTPSEIAREVRRNLDFLETELRDVPERQRSVRAAFDHSWNLLTEREREVVAASSVFRGGFTREAARAVTGASLRELMALVDRSLVTRDAGGRYGMHELLRGYAAERLKGSPTADEAAHDRHCAYYIAALRDWGEDLKGPRRQAALVEVDVEIENARAAWDWAAVHGQARRLDQALEGLALYYDFRWRPEEGEAACRLAAEKLTPTAEGDDLRLLVRVLIWQGVFCERLSRTELARRLLERGQAVLARPELAGQDTRREKAFVLREMGHRVFDSDLEEAQRLYEQSLAQYRAVGDPWWTAAILERLGWLAFYAGAYDAWQRGHEESLVIRRELGDSRGTAESLAGLGTAVLLQGQFEQGERLLRGCVTIAKESGDRAVMASALVVWGWALIIFGRFAEAYTVLEEGLALSRDLGARSREAWASFFWGYVELHVGSYAQARAWGEKVLAFARELDAWVHLGRALWLLGDAALPGAAYAEAQRLLARSAATYREHGLPHERVMALANLAAAARGLHQIGRSKRHLCEALRTSIKIQAVLSAYYPLGASALLLADAGEAERAVEVYALASRYPLVANSQWFEDVFGRHIAAAAATLPPEVVAAAQERGRSRDLWETASELLEELKDLEWGA